MLYQYYQKIKECASVNQTDLFLAGLIFLASVGSFGLGRLSALWPEKQPLYIDEIGGIVESAVRGLDKTVTQSDFTKRSDSSVSPFSSGQYVASKNGSAYHYPWCSGAKRIKKENKIWFQTKEEAEAKGYKPAANCDGL